MDSCQPINGLFSYRDFTGNLTKHELIPQFDLKISGKPLNLSENRGVMYRALKKLSGHAPFFAL